MTKDQNLCIYKAYYKLAREGNSYTEWYTVHFPSLNVLVLIHIPKVFVFLSLSLEVPFLLYILQLVAS